ncbi:MAG: MgtC/SapB family protein [Clostridia bacterium]|nr:MgtC/SapB family protein [Clostridia bacterium]
MQIRKLSSLPLGLVTAVICGAAIGVERTLRQKEAGIRTHIIVALGSALIMIVSKYGFFDIIGLADHVNLDGARLAAQVVTGISFLGAGIIVYKGTVKGLTTAAGVWTTAGIGLAAGAGMYGIAVYATLILLIVQIVIHKLLPVENTSTASVTMKLIDDAEAVEIVTNIFKENGYTILSNSVERRNEKYACLFTIRAKSHINPDEITNLFSGNEYVISVSV